MAEIAGQPRITLRVTMSLSEEEARALEAIASYDHQVVLQLCYQHLGRAYLQPHEGGFLSLLRSAREHLPRLLKRADEARAVFDGEKAT